MLIIKYIAAIVFTITIAAICFTPGNELPNSPFLNFDKIVHISIFGLLTFLWMLPFVDAQSSKVFYRIAFLLIGYGIFIEFIQHYFISGRSGDSWDALANTLGILGVAVFFLQKHRN